MYASHSKINSSSSMISSSKRNGSISCTSFKGSHFLFSRQKTLNHRVANLIFPALRTPFSFQPFAQSPHCQSSCVLHLKLTIIKLTNILQKDLLSVHLFERIINRYLTFTSQDCNPLASVSDTTRTCTLYFKLPYIGLLGFQVRIFILSCHLCMQIRTT